MRHEYQLHESPVATATHRIFPFAVCIDPNKCTLVPCLVDVVRRAKDRGTEAVMLDRVTTYAVYKITIQVSCQSKTLPCLTSWLRNIPVMPFSSHQRLVTSGPNPKPTPNFFQYKILMF